MCTTTYEKPILQIAQEDIVCYKRVNITYEPISKFRLYILREKPRINRIYSYHYGFKYELNKVYHTSLCEFTSLCTSTYNSHSGFYSYDTPAGCNVKCIIPKGAEYYLVRDLNTNRMIYTSNQIKIVSEI